MAKQKGNSEPILGGFGAVDATLKRIKEIDREIALVEAKKNERIDHAKLKAIEISAPLTGEKKELVRNIKDYCEFNKELFLKTRSREMNWGSVGFRMSPPALKTLVRWTWDKVLAKLKEAGRSDFIAVKESVDKEAVRKAKLESSGLSIYGMRLVSKEEFWFETKEDDLKDAEKSEAKQRALNV